MRTTIELMFNSKTRFTFLFLLIAVNLSISQITVDFGDAKNGLILPKNDSSLVVNDAVGQMFSNIIDSSLYIFDGFQWRQLITAITHEGNMVVGKAAGRTFDSFQKENTMLGSNVGTNLTISTRNTFIGSKAGEYSDTTVDNTFIGYQAGQHNKGAFNVYVGNDSGKSLGSGDHNSGFGYEALSKSNGSYNVAQGSGALSSALFSDRNTSVGFYSMRFQINGHDNTALGYEALASNSLGIRNVALGSKAGRRNRGSGSIFIGYRAGYMEQDSNKLYIHNDSTANPLIYGEFDTLRLGLNGSVGIRTNSPTTSLHVLQMLTPSAAVGNHMNVEDGIKIEAPTGFHWTTFIDGFKDYNFAALDTLWAYIRDDDGAYVTAAGSAPLLFAPTKKKEKVLETISKMEVYSLSKSTNKSKAQSIGFRSSDVKKYFPEAYAKSGNKEGIIYDQFAVLAIQGIKELVEENNKLKEDLRTQKDEIEVLKNEMKAYMKKVDHRLKELGEER
tara:strand:- start:77 stop:1579 length:1503 start_codon:yes stop_codon:yes gene_type:complete